MSLEADLSASVARSESPALSVTQNGLKKRKIEDLNGTSAPQAPSPGPSAPSTSKSAARGKTKAKTGKAKAAGAAKKQTKKSSAAARRARALADLDASVSPEPEDAVYQPPPEAIDEEEDDRVYCICQEPYDPQRMMIACDSCDEWYHLDCINVAETDVELINDFVCPKCELSSDARTSWKIRCHRPGCNKAAVSLSKYCTDWCGIEVAATRLDKITLEGGPARYWPVVVDAHKPVSIVERADDHAPKPPVASTSSQHLQLADLDTQRATAEAALTAIEARLRLLALAVRRADVLRQQHLATLAARGPGPLEPVAAGKKGKAKKAGKGKGAKGSSAADDAEAPCGFDIRLVWDDQDWEPWASSGELEREEAQPGAVADAQVVCMQPRKQCDRHAGWQRLQEASFSAEKAGQMRKLDRLAAQERKMRLLNADELEARAGEEAPKENGMLQ